MDDIQMDGVMPMELYQHQEEAINKMKNGCILCGGVGSGKSITSITYFMTKVCDGYYKRDDNGEVAMRLPSKCIPLYIITTARKRDTHEWESELANWCLSTDEKVSWLGTKVVIDSWNNIEKYADVKDAFFIFDEQRVVGYGKWSKTFIRISKTNAWIMLSATPGDSWVDYMSVFIANGFYKNKTDFYNKHVILTWDQRGNYPKITRYDNEHTLIKHRDDILIDMKFGRLTVPHHLDVYCEYDKDLYRKAEKDRVNVFDIDERGNMVPSKDISEVIRVMRKVVATNPDRLDKLKKIVDIHKKVIVFYNFAYELDMLREWCEANDIVKAEWNGQKHEMLPSGDEWIYLVQYIAGAEGWNCTTCNTIVFYSQSYSYKQTEQACGRIDRLNTPYTDLYYYHFTSKSSIDIIIKKTLNRKEEFNDRKMIKEWERQKEEAEDPFAQYYD